MIMKWWQKRFLVGLLYTLCYCRGTREQYTRRDGGCCCPAGSWWPLHGPLRLTPVPHHSTTCHYSQMEIKDNKPHHHSPAAPSYVSYLYTSSFFLLRCDDILSNQKTWWLSVGPKSQQVRYHEGQTEQISGVRRASVWSLGHVQLASYTIRYFVETWSIPILGVNKRVFFA